MNLLARLLHKLGDAAACGETDPDYEQALFEELCKLQENGDSLHDDLRKVKEAIGYLYQRLSSLDSPEPQHPTNIIKMK